MRIRLALITPLLGLAPLACGDSSSDAGDEVGETAASADGTASTDTSDTAESSGSGSESTTDTGTGSSSEDSSTGDSSSDTDTSADSSSGTDTGSESSSGTDTDTGSDTGTDTDTGSTDTGNPIWGEWLLTSDMQDGAVRLLRVDLSEGQEGQIDVLCPDVALPMEVPQSQFTSLAFVDNVLYAVRNQFLMTVDPCDCTASLVGTFEQSGIAGIAVNANDVMYGISAGSNALLEINPQDASTQVLVNFPFNVGNHGLTWSNLEVNELYFIEASADVLRVLDGSDPAMEKSQVPLSIDFSSVGAEMHPGNEVLYACTGSNELYAVDIATGTVDVVAVMDGYNAPCGAIGAPWGPVDCVPQ